MQQGSDQQALERLQGQSQQYAAPPAPTFASLGSNQQAFTASLGSLAHGQPPQPTTSAQGLSAITNLMHNPHPTAFMAPIEKKAGKKEESAFGLILPLHKVKKLIKSENSVKAVSGEASFAIARATELLVEQLVVKAYQKMEAESRDMIAYDDVASAVTKWSATDFLRDIVPETLSLSDLVQMAKKQDEAKS